MFQDLLSSVKIQKIFAENFVHTMKVKLVLEPHCANEIISTCWKGSNDSFLIAYHPLCTVLMSVNTAQENAGCFVTFEGE